MAVDPDIMYIREASVSLKLGGGDNMFEYIRIAVGFGLVCYGMYEFLDWAKRSRE